MTTTKYYSADAQGGGGKKELKKLIDETFEKNCLAVDANSFDLVLGDDVMRKVEFTRAVKQILKAVLAEDVKLLSNHQHK